MQERDHGGVFSVLGWELPADCGLVLDRDINASVNIEQEGIEMLIREGKLTGTERCLSGGYPSTLAQQMVDYYNTIPRVSARVFNEAGSSLRSS